MNEVKLNYKQITQLAHLTDHFPEVEHFTVNIDSSSGTATSVVAKIGNDIVIKFMLK